MINSQNFGEKFLHYTCLRLSAYIIEESAFCSNTSLTLGTVTDSPLECLFICLNVKHLNIAECISVNFNVWMGASVSKCHQVISVVT